MNTCSNLFNGLKIIFKIMDRAEREVASGRFRAKLDEEEKMKREEEKRVFKNYVGTALRLSGLLPEWKTPDGSLIHDRAVEKIATNVFKLNHPDPDLEGLLRRAVGTSGDVRRDAANEASSALAGVIEDKFETSKNEIKSIIEDIRNEAGR